MYRGPNADPEHQAEWLQGRGIVVYDATAETLVGPVAPMVCDLSQTTARVFAVLSGAIVATDELLQAFQDPTFHGYLLRLLTGW